MKPLRRNRCQEQLAFCGISRGGVQLGGYLRSKGAQDDQGRADLMKMNASPGLVQDSVREWCPQNAKDRRLANRVQKGVAS